MSAFTVSAVAAPGAAKFASRNANARRPAAAPARVVRRAGRVAQQVVAKAGPSGEVKKVRATDALEDRRCPIEDARVRSRATSTFPVGAPPEARARTRTKSPHAIAIETTTRRFSFRRCHHGPPQP
jgi:hypothetical protein